jgi:hypothetical protein
MDWFESAVQLQGIVVSQQDRIAKLEAEVHRLMVEKDELFDEAVEIRKARDYYEDRIAELIEEKWNAQATIAKVNEWADENEYPCICSEEYKRIGRVDPSCRKCDSGFDELRDIISDQRKVLAVVEGVYGGGRDGFMIDRRSHEEFFAFRRFVHPQHPNRWDYKKATVIVLKKGGE